MVPHDLGQSGFIGQEDPNVAVQSAGTGDGPVDPVGIVRRANKDDTFATRGAVN